MFDALQDAANQLAIDNDGSAASKVRWYGHGLILKPTVPQWLGDWRFDNAGVKDPSVVFYKDYWHVFYTGSDGVNGTIGYVRAKKFSELNAAPRYAIDQARGLDDPKIGWGVAPQIFYFEPHGLWYLLYQSRDTKFQPMICTNKDIFNENGWSNPKRLLEKDSDRKWIDFWLIGDKNDMYLFYTEQFRPEKKIMFRKSPMPAFGRFRSFPDPSSWGPA